MITEPDPAPPHGIERHYSIDPTEREFERIADALETIAHCLSKVCGPNAVRVDKLL